MARQYGRWEARVRGRNYGTSGTAYRAVWELTPTSYYHCGARNIVLSDYALGTNRVAMHVRKLPNRDFTASKPLALADNQFHTHAIEVTPDHVVVRRHQGDQDRATIRCPDGRPLQRPLPAVGAPGTR